MPHTGPAIAKSNSDLMFFGGDIIGVIVPVKPRETLGINVGGPILIFTCHVRKHHYIDISPTTTRYETYPILQSNNPMPNLVRQLRTKDTPGNGHG